MIIEHLNTVAVNQNIENFDKSDDEEDSDDDEDSSDRSSNHQKGTEP